MEAASRELSFRAYLSARPGASTPAGEFAHRVLSDPAEPDFRNWRDLALYLDSRQAPVVEMYAARGVWNAYSRRQRRKAR
jgi:hypothetical protein